MIKRNLYLDAIKPFIGKPQIKILTGIRRSGKSTLLRLLHRSFLESGIPEDRIIAVNLESFRFFHLRDAAGLYRYVDERISAAQPGDRFYLLFDEIQEVHEWEKAINAFTVDFNADIYLTGSNSFLLSSELATRLSGRFVEIPVFTLSFKEHRQFRVHYFPDESKEHHTFENYLRTGGFPVIHTARYTTEAAYKVVYDIYSSVLLRDTIQRFNIRDIELLERVVHYIFDNIGNTFSGKNVADYFKSQQRRVDINTVYNYLKALEGAFIVYRVPRYDIKGREILKTQEKFYLSDVSLLYAALGYRDRQISGILENIIFLELKRRGYRVFVGKSGHREIDFIAERQGEKMYIQAAYKLESAETADREFSELLRIRDQYPKYVITMDDFWKESVGGVRHLHIRDFLLSDEF